MLFLGPRLQLQTGRSGQIRFGRFVWVGTGTKIRCHEGMVEIGAKTVIGQEVTISAYQRVRIGAECVIADRAMFIDFDHVVDGPRAADPPPGHLQARRRGRLQRVDRLRRPDPSRRHRRRQRDRSAPARSSPATSPPTPSSRAPPLASSACAPSPSGSAGPTRSSPRATGRAGRGRTFGPARDRRSRGPAMPGFAGRAG